MVENTNEGVNPLLAAALIGIGATAFMDLWALFLKIGFQLPVRSYDMVGRWIGHMAHGQLVHINIAASPAIVHENIIGWIVHYLTGIVFAAGLLTLWGPGWVSRPTLFPALCIGLVTILFPFFVMQPCLGYGIAASNLPQPDAARLRSLMGHASFGLGLYVSARIVTLFLRAGQF